MDTKAANRQARAHSEGIYIVSTRSFQQSLYMVVCTICEKELNASPLVKASHAKKHVREGTVYAREVRGHDGLRKIWERKKDGQPALTS